MKNPEHTTNEPRVVSMDGLSGTVWKKLDQLIVSDLLVERFPRFVAAFAPLHEAIKKTFSCGIDAGVASTADIAVYGLGRLCLEDFVEILFLAEHDYGYAAVKLLRGLYERAVVNEIIVENPTEEGVRFFKNYAVDERKFHRRAAEVYEGWNVDPSTMQESSDAIKDASRKRYALDALARKLGQATNNPSLQELGKQLKRFYLHCAAIPNIYIHASMFSILQRLTETPETFIFDPARYAVSNAHILMLMALAAQNQYFALGMDTTLDRLHEDRAVAWPNRSQWAPKMPAGNT